MKLIKSTYNDFLSVPQPYLGDKFVAANYVEVDLPPVAGTVAAGYAARMAGNALLRNLLRQLHAWGPGRGDALEVVDIGVYMGTFSIGIELLARHLGLPVAIAAFEANPELLAPIRSNITLYGCSATLQHGAVGRRPGTMEFVWSEGGAIGGTVFNTQNKKQGEFHAASVPVVPLADIVATRAAPALVKIDIEGNEVNAFASLLDHPGTGLDHVYIVEFAPWQFEQKLGEGMLYGDFLLEHFQVLNIANWMSGRLCEPVDTREALRTCLKDQRSFNTDLLLIPKARRVAPADLLRD